MVHFFFFNFNSAVQPTNEIYLQVTICLFMIFVAQTSCLQEILLVQYTQSLKANLIFSNFLLHKPTFARHFNLPQSLNYNFYKCIVS